MELNKRQWILIVLMFGMIVNLYSVSDVNVLESKTYASTFGLTITIMTIILYILFTTKEDSTLSLATIGLVITVLIGGFLSNIYSKYVKKTAIFATASSALGNTMVLDAVELGLLLGIVAVGMSIANNSLNRYLSNSNGWIGFVLYLLFFIPCLLEDFAEYVKSELQLASSVSYMLLAAEFLLVGAYIIIPKLLSKQLTSSGTSILKTPMFLNQSNVQTFVKPDKGEHDRKRANYAISMWTFVNQQSKTNNNANIFTYGEYPKIQYVKGTNVVESMTKQLDPIIVNSVQEFVTTETIRIVNTGTTIEPQLLYYGKTPYIDSRGVLAYKYKQINPTLGAINNILTKEYTTTTKMSDKCASVEHLTDKDCPLFKPGSSFSVTFASSDKKSNAYDVSANAPIMLVELTVDGAIVKAPISYGIDLKPGAIRDVQPDTTKTLFNVNGKNVLYNPTSTVAAIHKQNGDAVMTGDVVMEIKVQLVTTAANLGHNFITRRITSPMSGTVKMSAEYKVGDKIADNVRLFTVYPASGDTYKIAVGPHLAYDIVIPAQRWNNIVLNYNDDSTVDVFVNGNLERTFTDTTKIQRTDVKNKTPTPIQIGEKNGMYGAICNINYYDSPLAKTQIANQYNLLMSRNPPVNNIA